MVVLIMLTVEASAMMTFVFADLTHSFLKMFWHMCSGIPQKLSLDGFDPFDLNPAWFAQAMASCQEWVNVFFVCLCDNKLIFLFVYILHRANLIVDCILEKSDARTGGLSEAVGVFGP